MVWSNAPLVVYHGTTDIHVQSIIDDGPIARLGNKFTDFGRGFYVTTSRIQAEDWANKSYQKLVDSNSGAERRAAVIEFSIDRNRLSELDTLSFVNEKSVSGYWEFIGHCRNGPTYQTDQGIELACHARSASGKSHYDVVYGPVSLWPQRHVMKDCDQISFHTGVALVNLLGYISTTYGAPAFTSEQES